MVAEPAAGTHLCHPGISPDDQWPLNNQATGGNSYADAQGQRWVTKLDGSMTPIRRSQVDMPAAYTSWPTWTPFAAQETSTTPTGEPRMWFTFASRRRFKVRSAASQNIAAYAIRLRFENLARGNHIAQWTQAIVAVD